MSAPAPPKRRRIPPQVYYVIAVAGAFALPLIGRLGQFMGDFGIVFYSLCALAMLPWIGLFCWLAWRRTDEVAQAAHRTAWVTGGAAGAAIALASVLLAIVIATQHDLTFKMRSSHAQAQTAATQAWTHKIELSTGPIGTPERRTSTWTVEGDGDLHEVLNLVFGHGFAAGVLAAILFQALCAAAVWGGWWGRVWGAGLERRKSP